MADNRWPAQHREASILSTAVSIANNDGIAKVSFESVASSSPVKITARTVRHYYPKIALLWSAVAAHPKASKIVKQDAQAMGVK